MSAEIETEIRNVLDQHARLPGGARTLGADDDLFAAGMTSHASVSVMLALEDAFDLEFPDEMLKRSVFASVTSILSAVTTLQQATA